MSKTNEKDKGLCSTNLAGIMKVVGKMIQEMDLGEKFLKMETLMRVSLNQINLMVEAYTNGRIKQNMKEIG